MFLYTRWETRQERLHCLCRQNDLPRIRTLVRTFHRTMPRTEPLLESLIVPYPRPYPHNPTQLCEADSLDQVQDLGHSVSSDHDTFPITLHVVHGFTSSTAILISSLVHRD
jgi:hypothetical protein